LWQSSVKLLIKRSNIPLWKKYDIIVSLNGENGTKVGKIVKDLDLPTMMLTKVSKNKNKIISHFFLSEYMLKHDTVCDDPNQRILTFARLWH